MHRQVKENGDRDEVRYSAAYPTCAERIVVNQVEHFALIGVV